MDRLLSDVMDTWNLCMGRETIRIVCPRRLMDTKEFLMSLGDFLASKVDASAAALADV